MKKVFARLVVVVVLLALLSVAISSTPDVEADGLCPVGTPIIIYPTNSSTNVPITTILDWDCSNASIYQVYFGTNSSAPSWIGNTSNSYWDNLSTLSSNTKYYWKIVAWDTCSNNSSSGIWNFTTECLNPGTPGNESPHNTSTSVSVNADLDWDNCPDATYYEVYFGNTSTPPLFNSSTTVSNLSLSKLNDTTTYYWKIVARNGCGGSTNGSLWRFTTGCAAAGTPGNESPHDASTTVSVNADLNWDNCSDATYYQVYFGTTSTPPLYDSSNASNLVLPLLSSSTTYYWKIVANNGCDDSTNGSIWNFTTECAALGTPAYTSPANSSTGVSVNVDLNWEDCAGASYYQVYFSTNSLPATLVGSPNTSNWTLSNLSSNTKYYWKIIARDICGGNASGLIWNFTTGCATPGTPDTPTPVNASTGVSADSDLDWGDCSYATYYQVYCDTNSSPSMLVGSLNASGWALPPLSVNTTYYWKVVAKNGCGGSTNGSIWSFTTAGCTAPGTPSSPSPADVSTGIFIDADLAWNNSANATYYQVYFGTNSSPSTLVGSPNASSWTLPAMSVNTTYYWKVVAKNGCGSTNGSIWSFTTGVCATPSKPQTLSPINGSANISAPITLDWADCANASSYDVYFNTSSTPSYYASTNNSSYLLSQLNYSTKYYWKVVAKNSCGLNNSSDIWSFTTVCVTPSKPQTTPLSPTNGSTNISASITLDWADCANASSYDVYFNTSATPSYYASTNNSSYQLPQLAYSTKYYWKVVAKNSCSVNNSSDIWNFTTGAAPAPPPTISFNIGGTSASWNTSSSGVIQQVVNITSADAKINLYIPLGTTALNSEGEPLDELNMSSATVYPDASGDRRVIAAFDFEPDGATFDPGIEITLTYDPDTIPSGVNESSLIVAFYNESSEGWEYITGIVNTSANTITFTVHHFTTFTIQTPPVHESAGLGAWVIIVIVFAAAIVLGLAGGLYIKYRRIYGSLYYEDEGDADDKYDQYREDREDEGDFKF